MIQSRADLDSYGWLESVAEMKDMIQKGPLSIAVSAGNDCWRFYESGILSSANKCPKELDHGVVVVGLDESGDQPYWIVQNSWDTMWGEHGFIKLAVEEGDGVSGMNMNAECIDVQPGYPQEAAPVENCDHDETLNPLGPQQCSNNDECTGLRICDE